MPLFEPANQNPVFDILYQQYLARQKNTEDLLTVVGDSSSLEGDFETLEDVVAALVVAVEALQPVEGSYTGTFTGVSGTPPTVTINYTLLGDVVIWSMQGNTTGTSNSTSFTVTGAPAIIRPSVTSAVMPCLLNDNSTAVRAEFRMDTNGTLIGSVGGGSTGFTAAGNKGTLSGRMPGGVYKLTNP